MVKEDVLDEIEGNWMRNADAQAQKKASKQQSVFVPNSPWRRSDV